MRGTRDSRLACKLRGKKDGGRHPSWPSDFLEKTSAANHNPNPTSPSPSLPPPTRQLSTPRTAKMLFSVSRASVRRPPDEPGDGRPPIREGCCCPVLQQSGFSELVR